MAIDIRSAVSCSLGTVISGGINDDSVIQAGLVRVTGSVLISGLITPAIGTAVTVSYVKAGVARQINRSLRVLSSFADPFKRTTSVKLGCKLTYLQDLKEPINWTALDDPANTLTAEDARIITLPIRAQAIAEQCLTKLGITGSLSLTNQFSVASFDLGGGYVDVLGRLLESECLCGWLNASDVLQVFSLDQAGGTGPVIDSTQLIDLSEIGSGQLPGEAVTVSYSTVKLRPGVTTTADAVERRNWERSESIGLPTLVSISNPFYGENPYTIMPYSVPEFLDAVYVPRSENFSRYDAWNRLVYRENKNYTILAELAPSYITYVTVLDWYAKSFAVANWYQPPDSYREFNYGLRLPPIANLEYYLKSITTVEYEIPATEGVTPPDDYEKISRETVIDYEPYVKLMTSTSVYDLALERFAYFPWKSGPQDFYVSRKTITTYETSYDEQGAQISRTKNETYQAYGLTQRGQQYLSAVFRDKNLWSVSASNFVSNGTAEKILQRAAELTYQGIAEQITVGREINLQRRPSAADRVTADLAGQTVASSSELALAMGSPTAQRRTEFSLPYAPDDTFYKSGSTYGSTTSDAPQKAQRYGLVQNRLLLGNRSGLGIQAAPEVLPSTPFAPFVLRSGGVSALYRTNALSWTFDAQGMVASCDALFWGGVGGSGPIWFPVAPGITTLPAAPGTTTVNILDGSGNVVGSYQQMAVSAVVPVWNETRKLVSRLRLRAQVTSLPYALQVVSETTIRTRLRMTVKTGTLIDVPAAAIEVAGWAPTVSTSTVVQVPAAAIVVSGQAPTIETRAIIEVPAAAIVIAAAVPQIKAPYDPYEASNKLLLPLTGANNSTTFTDYSPLAHTVTANGNARISTAESIFDGSSLYLDGSSTTYLTIPESSGFTFAGDFTLEGWLYLPVTPSGSYAAIFDSRDTQFGSSAITLVVDSDRKLKLFRGASPDLESSSNAISLTTWTHFAVSRVGSTLGLYAAGSQLATVTDSVNRSQNGPVYIGRVYDNVHAAFNGYLSYMRLTAVGRYSGTYTVPGRFSL